LRRVRTLFDSTPLLCFIQSRIHLHPPPLRDACRNCQPPQNHVLKMETEMLAETLEKLKHSMRSTPESRSHIFWSSKAEWYWMVWSVVRIPLGPIRPQLG
jgi:hypothetical protein